MRKEHMARPSGHAEAVTAVIVTGLPSWLAETAFEGDLTQRLQGDLQNVGLIRGSVEVSQLKEYVAEEDDSDSPLHRHEDCPHPGIRLSLQLESDSQRPILKFLHVDCKVYEAGSFISRSSRSSDMSDWGSDVWSARMHWEQHLLRGLSQYSRRRETQISVDERSHTKSTVWTFITDSSAGKRALSLGPDEETVWELYGPAALVELLSELIMNSAMRMAARFLRSTYLDTLEALPFWPQGLLTFANHFPPLRTEDMYVDSDKQLCPDLFLRLAAIVWTAASQGISTLETTLLELQQYGMPLVKFAINTPVVYKSGGRHRSLSGPLLMFVVDQMNKQEAAGELVQMLLANTADPNASYVLFPTGKQKAVGRFPLLCLAGNRQAHGLAEMLLHHGADANREISLNYFPHGGNALWSAVWGSDYNMIRLLLSFGDADVNVRAWHPDAPPLTGQARHLQLLSLASTALDSEHVHLLLECKADFQEDLSSTFSACHAEVTRLLASHVAYSHPEAIVHRCHELTGTCGVWIDWVFQEIAGDVTSKRLFRSGLSKASADLDLHHSFMRLLCDLIQRLPTAAAQLLDKICLQSPTVQEPGRHPLQTRCLFQAHEIHTAYLAETRWSPNGTKFQNVLAPPERKVRGQCLGLLPSMQQLEFCDVQLVGIPGLIDVQVLLALRSVPWLIEIAVMPVVSAMFGMRPQIRSES